MIALSIDWDWFPYNGEHDADRKMKCYAGTKYESDVPICRWFDWGHSESRGDALQSLIWHSRGADFHKTGNDIEKVCAIDPSVGCVTVDDFASTLHERYDLGDAEFDVHDSHSAGYPSMTKATELNGGIPVELIHFDAHHDLGYDSDSVRRAERVGRCDCADWLYFAIKTLLVAKVTIVYPDWKGKVEFTGMESMTHFNRISKRVEVTTWREFVARPFSRLPVEVVNVARSGAWVPPHLDGEFERMVRKIGCHAFEMPSDMKREWNRETVAKLGEQSKQVMGLYQNETR